MRAGFTALCVLLIPTAVAAQGGPISLRVETDEAEAALAILDARAADGSVPDSLWNRLSTSGGLTRLIERENAMGRPLTLEDMRTFLRQDSLLPLRERWRQALESWRALSFTEIGARALAYLPAGTPVQATVYLLIKPRTNSFVYDLRGRPAIMLYLDPEMSPAVVANTVAHELHHIGLGAACGAWPDSLYADTSAAANLTRNWLGAFGEGLAMLAAAGGPEVHPHQDSPAATRERWDHDMAEAPGQMVEVERFFTAILDGRLTGDSVTAGGMTFFGVQGPWYTLGYRMWATVERRRGRARVIADACEPARLILDYNQAVRSERGAPRWSAAFTSRLQSLLKRRM